MPSHPPLPFPFILKEATGRGGQEVFLIADEASWQNTVPKVKTNDLLIQSTVNIQLGKDVRVFIIGKQIIAAVLRENKCDFRANFKLGGSATLFDLTEEMRTLITTIVNHFDFGLVGIDFLLNKKGEFVFNEIEDVVGSRILSVTTNINLLEYYVAFIKAKVENDG
jgi:gamma-F420-2:alpha-L-glutamate ligase